LTSTTHGQGKSKILKIKKSKSSFLNHGILRGEVTIDLLFDWFGLVFFANRNENW